MWAFISALATDVKNHPGIAVLFLAIGLVFGLCSHNWLMASLNSKYVLVVADSYMDKNEVAKSYVPIEKYTQINGELQKSQEEREKLASQNKSISEDYRQSKLMWSSAICQRFEQDIASITSKQDRVEGDIQRTLLTVMQTFDREIKKDPLQIEGDRARAAELRKQSEGLSQQLAQLRSEMVKCTGK
jgi:predicted Zn-dependent protease